MQRKLAGWSLLVAFVAAAVVIWTTPPSFTRQVQPSPEATPTISPYELQVRIDIKGMSVQETADLF